MGVSLTVSELRESLEKGLPIAEQALRDAYKACLADKCKGNKMKMAFATKNLEWFNKMNEMSDENLLAEFNRDPKAFFK